MRSPLAWVGILLLAIALFIGGFSTAILTSSCCYMPEKDIILVEDIFGNINEYDNYIPEQQTVVLGDFE